MNLSEDDIKAIENEIKKLEKELSEIKGTKCEVWSRCVGYFRPVSEYNPGKQEEFKDRVEYEVI
jgi:hypothetical protein